MSWWEFWKPKIERLEFVRDFLEVNKHTIPGIRSINQLKFTVLDTETTGLEPSMDSILSFGAVKISDLKIQVPSAVEWYPKSDKKTGKASLIHGLVRISDQISVEEFLKKLLPYLNNSIIIGHHIGFDLEMINKELKPFGINQLPNPVIDTLNLAIRLEHGPNADRSRIAMGAYSLDELCNRYGIEPDDRHTAGGDAFLTAQLFLKLLKLADKKGIRTFKDLIR
ncbi:PolC-type DNA polymerase III [Algoriphagus sp.]|uniref:3'-5' exonuclease n=1 Tax=Algoriphagus sp. TaxID=1872435 RepID=UPI00391CC49C